MAVISTTVTADLFQQIRDKIASILLDELDNQATLQDNTALSFEKIWMERSRPFNLSEIPAINLSIASVNYNDKFRGQRNVDATYTIDVYDYKVYTDDEDAEQVVTESNWNLIRNIQYILDHSAYANLQLKPYIFHTEVTGVDSGQGELTDGSRCGILRLKFTVKTISTLDGVAPIDLSQLNTTVTIEQTNKGYYYQLINS